MRLVSVVASTRSPAFRRFSGSPEQVVDLHRRRAHLDLRVDEAGGAHHLLDHAARRAPPNRPGVALTTTIACGMRSHSSNFRGRLSSADGRRNPYSTSVSLRERSPRYMPPICGMRAWLVDKDQRVVGQVFEERRRRLARARGPDR
jgi:hypothetical protein